MIRTALSKNSRQLGNLLQRRAFHSSMYSKAATFFNMPAMSPTMEQGGIVKWHFKEGDSFSAGDSLLEVETDKATIDVEVQDDGILAKIVLQEGTKDIPVGQPIAIVAEPGDDLSTIELPKIEESKKPEAPAAASKPAESKKEEPTPAPPALESTKSSQSAESIGKKANPLQKFFPSVEILLEENNISREDALAKIQASAPNGKITKGDVLAYLGKISQDSVNSITSYIESHKHLDLSNIQLKKPEEKSSESEAKSSKDTIKKPSKPEPVKIAKTFVFSQPISEERLSQIVSKASKISEQYSYSSSLYQPSDLVDPLFEDIISPPTNTDRFKISVKINEPVSSTTTTSSSPDIFDYLTSSQPKVVSVATGAAMPSVDVELTLNDKVIDSKQRAELFIAKFGELLATPQDKAKLLVEEFEF